MEGVSLHRRGARSELRKGFRASSQYRQCVLSKLDALIDPRDLVNSPHKARYFAASEHPRDDRLCLRRSLPHRAVGIAFLIHETVDGFPTRTKRRATAGAGGFNPAFQTLNHPGLHVSSWRAQSPPITPVSGAAADCGEPQVLCDHVSVNDRRVNAADRSGRRARLRLGAVYASVQEYLPGSDQ